MRVRPALLSLAAAAAAGAAAFIPAIAGAATPSTVPAATTAAVPAPACTPAAKLTVTPRTGTYLHAAIHTQTVSGRALCAGTTGVPGFVKSINANANDQLAQWKKDWKDASQGATLIGSYDRTNKTVVNVKGLVVLEGDAYLYLGGAHGNDVVTYDLLNTRSGAIVTKSGMLAEMQKAGGPYWYFERELNRWADAANPDPHSWITRADIAMYPTKPGMHIAVQHCAAYACADGTVEYTIPWPSLIAPDANMSFIPDQWGH